MYHDSWENIPPELRNYDQWCFTDPNAVDGHVKAPRRIGGYKADKTNPAHWMTFEEACFNAKAYGGDIGFCLSENDPYTCIDLDVKNKDTHPEKPWLWTSTTDLDRQWKIIQAFNSYTEKSRSGNGSHIWLLGDIGKGAHHASIEIYSRDAFIICTGKVALPTHIGDGGETLSILYSEIRQQQNSVEGSDDISEGDEYFSDHDIFEKAVSADNFQKFNMLCSLQVEDATRFYPSNSEADLALLSIFAFYTDSNKQVKRLFRYAPLSKRDKSLQNDVYLDRSIRGIRKRWAEKEARMAYVDSSIQNILNENTRNLKRKIDEAQHTPVHVVTGYDPEPITDTSGAVPELSNVPEAEALVGESELTFPPGLVGNLARWILANAKRPNMEVAVAAALAFYSGICGRAWNVNGTGLNLYIVLIGRSGIGKEWLHGSISSILKQLQTQSPTTGSFFESNDHRSAQAMSKQVINKRVFLHLYNEWGKRLQLMTDERNTNAQEIRTLMTLLYHKSGFDSEFGGMSYSDKEKDVVGVGPVAYSMVGETVPKAFFSAISSSMLEDGTMGRFLHIETKAKRVPLTDKRRTPVPQALIDNIIEISNMASDNVGDGKVTDVSRTDEAAKLFAMYEEYCDYECNKDDMDEANNQLFNRAALKAMKIAALLAVGGGSAHTPVITGDHAQWAIDLVNRDIQGVKSRIEAGDLGMGELNRFKKIKQAFKYAMENRMAYGSVTIRTMLTDHVVPIGVLRQLCGNAACFKEHGSSTTSVMIDRALEAMINGGEVVEIPRTKLLADYSFTGRAYSLIDHRE